MLYYYILEVSELRGYKFVQRQAVKNKTNQVFFLLFLNKKKPKKMPINIFRKFSQPAIPRQTPSLKPRKSFYETKNHLLAEAHSPFHDWKVTYKLTYYSHHNTIILTK